MFYSNMAIDSIQNAKINFLKQTVKDSTLQKPLVDFVEAQRVFTKQVAKTSSDVMNIVSETFGLADSCPSRLLVARVPGLEADPGACACNGCAFGQATASVSLRA